MFLAGGATGVGESPTILHEYAAPDAVSGNDAPRADAPWLDRFLALVGGFGIACPGWTVVRRGQLPLVGRRDRREGPGQHSPSLRNMFRAGFQPLYERANWIWQSDSR
jgi:hypothetical protein